MLNDHLATLRAVTEPSFLTAVHDLFFSCCDTDQPLDVDTLLYFFGSNDDKIQGPLYDLCFEAALKPLSRIPLANFPKSLLPFLGLPEAREFPVMALGLHYLLDQVPRLLLHGMDERYTLAHFGPLALQLAHDLADLPKSLQPLRLARWRGLGLDFERAWLHAFMGASAFLHAEQLESQQLGQNICSEEYRHGAEVHYERKDPLRAQDETDSKDLTLFPKLAAILDSRTENMTREEILWRMCRYARAHEPVLRSFARFPYRNGTLGRTTTEDEKAWEDQTQRFGMIDPIIAKRIRADVEAGRWTPLQGGRPE